MSEGTKTMQLRMPVELHRKAKQTATEKGLSVNAFMRMVLIEAIKEVPPKPTGE